MAAFVAAGCLAWPAPGRAQDRRTVSGPVGLRPGVTLHVGAGRPDPCTDKFVPLPKAAPGDAPETPDSTAGLRR